MPANTAIDTTVNRAQLTVGRINSGMDENRVPMVGQILRIIRDISGKSEHMSVGDLVEFINGDPTIMGRIVSIACSVGYNTRAVEISSIHHAISLIGFDQVRTLAISLLLLEGAHSESVAKSNRELAGMSLISGLVAAEICRRRGGSDPDLAFICGALRNYGRLLAATFLPEQYATVVPPDRPGTVESFQSVFGLTPIEVGRDIMTSRLLPKSILNTLVSLPAMDRKHCCTTMTGILTGVADFGVRFAELLQSPDLNRGNFEQRIVGLSREYDVDFYLTGPEARELLNSLVGVLTCFRFRAGSYVGTVAVFRRLENLAAERVLSASVEPEVRPALPKPVLVAPPIDTADGYEI